VSDAYPEAYHRAREQLIRASAALAAEGIPGTEARGQLIRPLVAMAGLRDPEVPPAGFWEGVLAVQLAHEASLVHDDIVDGARERRGAPSVAAADGVPRALLQGDHLLTAAYRAAARTGSLAFVTLFARAVERTVAGEAEQGRVAGEVLERHRYEEIALGKSGELVGCALALVPTLEGRADAEELFEVGRRVGLIYQMLDDLLDYCPRTPTGKPPLGDYAQRRWTWVLAEAPGLPFGLDPQDARQRLHRPATRASAARRALARLEAEVSGLRAVLVEHLPGDRLLGTMLDEWVTQAREAVEREADDRPPQPLGLQVAVTSAAASLRERVPSLGGVEGYLATNSRSFRFALRFFPPKDADRVARVYAYCRITDDLVDRPPEGRSGEELLDIWLELSRLAYSGRPTGLSLLDQVLEEMAGARVPFDYAAELVEGMRMDLRGVRYASLPELRRYTYRVASVVGLWLTRLFGVHDPAVLERAEQMGHAMQLTNILRDVGEDWGRGRLYLPFDLLHAQKIDEEGLARMWAGGSISAGYRALVEELIGVAEADYRAALAALPSLPSSFARPVAVAAHLYRGIHREIRRRGYDNLRQRAYTGPLSKGVLAARALWELHRAPRPAAGAVSARAPLPGGGEE
jgi:phytoene synthase